MGDKGEISMVVYIDENENKIDSSKINSDTYRMTLIGFVNKDGTTHEKLDFSINDLDYTLYRAIKIPDEEIFANTKRKIRERRETECFPIINRGALWYNKLTDEQKTELSSWYEAWLNAPETMEIPEIPSWIK